MPKLQDNFLKREKLIEQRQELKDSRIRERLPEERPSLQEVNSTTKETLDLKNHTRMLKISLLKKKDKVTTNQVIPLKKKEMKNELKVQRSI